MKTLYKSIMKNLKTALLALALVFGVVAPMFANNLNAAYVQQDPTKQDVTLEELPEAIVEDIKANHAEAKFVSAVKWVNADESVKGYDVVLEQDEEKVTLSYDAEGVALEK